MNHYHWSLTSCLLQLSTIVILSKQRSKWFSLSTNFLGPRSQLQKVIALTDLRSLMSFPYRISLTDLPLKTIILCSSKQSWLSRELHAVSSIPFFKSTDSFQFVHGTWNVLNILSWFYAVMTSPCPASLLNCAIKSANLPWLKKSTKLLQWATTLPCQILLLTKYVILTHWKLVDWFAVINVLSVPQNNLDQFAQNSHSLFILFSY